MNPVLQVHELCKSYEQRLAVDRLGFALGPGEILGFVGPNGAGKTTTLRAITGILPPTSGSVWIGGVDLLRDPVAAKRQLAFVPDEPNLFGTLKVWEHLVFTARVYGLRAWEPEAARILADLELTARRDSLAEELSRGMRQKVALACALLHEPRLLLLDEPMTGLDPRGIRTLGGIIRRAAERGTGVVISSHLLGQIEGLCTRFLILARGRMIAFGNKEELRQQIPSLQENASLEEIFFHATEAPPGPAAAVPAEGGEKPPR
jgi:ABC-2 type transport system ATP-binding protein